MWNLIHQMVDILVVALPHNERKMMLKEKIGAQLTIKIGLALRGFDPGSHFKDHSTSRPTSASHSAYLYPMKISLLP